MYVYIYVVTRVHAYVHTHTPTRTATERHPHAVFVLQTIIMVPDSTVCLDRAVTIRLSRKNTALDVGWGAPSVSGVLLELQGCTGRVLQLRQTRTQTQRRHQHPHPHTHTQHARSDGAPPSTARNKSHPGRNNKRLTARWDHVRPEVRI